MSTIYEQDWEPLTITSAKAQQQKAVALASRPKVSQQAAQARKLDSADVPVRTKVLEPASRQAIVAFRVAQKKTQAEMNAMCSFPPNTIRDIEAGKLTPSAGQLNTLNRIMKTGLRLA